MMNEKINNELKIEVGIISGRLIGKIVQKGCKKIDFNVGPFDAQDIAALCTLGISIWVVFTTNNIFAQSVCVGALEAFEEGLEDKLQSIRGKSNYSEGVKFTHKNFPKSA